MSKSITIVEKKLRREKAVGQVREGERIIEIDPRQDWREVAGARERMDSVIHEYFHIEFPEWKEPVVIRRARGLTKLLWKDGFRRITPKPQ